VLRARLQNTAGVVWHGGVSRAQTNAILDNVDIASSWRAPSFDDSLEISTKVLEYSALGIPVLMNNCPVQARVFGADYRGWVSTADDFVERFCELATSPALYRQVSHAGLRTASAFTFARARHRLATVLQNKRAPVHARSRIRILFAGHDFKFLTPLLSRLERDPRYEVLMDQYQGHVIKDTARSAQLLARADLIFCEWSLGNAEWYSQHKRPDQPLVIREHLQGIRLPFLDRIEWNNVDRFIFCARGMMQEFLATRPFMAARSELIYIPIDCAAFDQPKLEGANFNLGVIGISPKRKAAHLAVEIFERLKREDSRYTLFIKGKHPWEYPWLWRKADERKYYHELYAHIHASPYANSMVFDGFGADVSDWFSKIGFILSTSDFEGSHQAVAEGMAAGAIPVIRNWTGAELLYPERHVFSTVDQAVDAIRGLRDRQHYLAEGDASRSFAREQFDQDEICDRLERLFTELLDAVADRAARAQPRPAHEQVMHRGP
jgi:glycosyltransferase involved in cell wall biosynthesis